MDEGDLTTSGLNTYVIRGQISLIFDGSSSSHREESFDISDTCLQHLEVPRIFGTLVTPKRSLFCPYHVIHVTFYRFFFCWTNSVDYVEFDYDEKSTG